MKKCSTSLVIKEMRIKTTESTNAVTKKTKKQNDRIWGKKEPLQTIGGTANRSSHYGNQYRGFSNDYWYTNLGVCEKE
jgi:hypothetical protein